MGSLSRHARSPSTLGLLEIVGAIGLIVPAATNTVPSLTVLAAAALVSAFFGVVAAVVVIGRVVVSPF
jgi:DoxX-like family